MTLRLTGAVAMGRLELFMTSSEMGCEIYVPSWIDVLGIGFWLKWRATYSYGGEMGSLYHLTGLILYLKIDKNIWY